MIIFGNRTSTCSSLDSEIVNYGNLAQYYLVMVKHKSRTKSMSINVDALLNMCDVLSFVVEDLQVYYVAGWPRPRYITFFFLCTCCFPLPRALVENFLDTFDYVVGLESHPIKSYIMGKQTAET